MIELLRKQLECFNDPLFKFDPKLHEYTYNNIPYISVTQFNEKFVKKFDSDYYSKRKADQTGVPQSFILDDWKKTADISTELGTEVHEWIEYYYKQVWKPLPRNLEVINRINKFNKIYAEQLYKLEPLQFETKIFSKKWKIAGTIDALFLYRGKIFIFDWKTNKELTNDKHIKGTYEKMLAPFQGYWANHINEYSIQLSLYSLILEEWGFNVDGAYLVHIGPNDEPAKVHKIVDMREQLKSFLDGSV
jgi:ATP-dependent exoDNAse (exonuclease V) beta subunit